MSACVEPTVLIEFAEVDGWKRCETCVQALPVTATVSRNNIGTVSFSPGELSLALLALISTLSMDLLVATTEGPTIPQPEGMEEAGDNKISTGLMSVRTLLLRDHLTSHVSQSYALTGAS